MRGKSVPHVLLLIIIIIIGPIDGSITYRFIPETFKRATDVFEAKLISIDSINVDKNGIYQCCLWKMQKIKIYKSRGSSNNILQDTFVIFGVRKDSISYIYNGDTIIITPSAKNIESGMNTIVFLFQYGTVSDFAYYLLRAIISNEKNKNLIAKLAEDEKK